MFEERLHKRIVITGMGSINALGHDVATYKQGLLKGVSGIGRLKKLPHDNFPVQISAEVIHPVVDNFDKHGFPSRSAAMAWLSASEALHDSALDSFEKRGIQLGLIGSVGWRTHRETELSGEESVQPALLNEGLECLAHQLKINGFVRSCLSACAATTQGIGQACERLLRKQADAVLVGGADSRIHDLGLVGYVLLGALTKEWNDNPDQASRPFDHQRSGFVVGEGGAFLVLETLEYAQKRGANIYAEISGWATTADAHRVTDPQPDGYGAARCMKLCLEKAGVCIDDVDTVNAHGTSTLANDAMESRALISLFGHRINRIPITAMKSQIGHLAMAAGVAETVGAVLMMLENQIAGTLNFHQNDPDLKYSLNILNKTRSMKRVKHVLKNSFGFGGQNACLLISKI